MIEGMIGCSKENPGYVLDPVLPPSHDAHNRIIKAPVAVATKDEHAIEGAFKLLRHMEQSKGERGMQPDTLAFLLCTSFSLEAPVLVVLPEFKNTCSTSYDCFIYWKPT